MADSNVIPIRRGRNLSGGPKSKGRPPPKGHVRFAEQRPHNDYRIVFYRKWGKGKRSTGERPKLLLNTPEYAVARHLFMEDSIFRRNRGEFCEVERFVDGKGWVPISKELMERWS